MPAPRRQLEMSRDDSDVRYHAGRTTGEEPPSRPGVFLRAVMRYVPQFSGDLALEAGDTILLVNRSSPDWFLGRNTRTGKVGVFPAGFVAMLS
jgi:hypothetical protein